MKKYILYRKHNGVQIDFGIQKTMSTILSAAPSATMLKSTGDEENGEDFDFARPCPPDCDERSIYNS